MNVKLMRAKRARWTRFDFNWIDCEILFIQTLKNFWVLDYGNLKKSDFSKILSDTLFDHVLVTIDYPGSSILIQKGFKWIKPNIRWENISSFSKILISTRLKFKKSSLEFRFRLNNIKNGSNLLTIGTR